MTTTPFAPDPVFVSALKEAWGHGYQQAVDTLRKMADEFEDEQCKAVLRAAAFCLQETKP